MYKLDRPLTVDEYQRVFALYRALPSQRLLDETAALQDQVEEGIGRHAELAKRVGVLDRVEAEMDAEIAAVQAQIRAKRDRLALLLEDEMRLEKYLAAAQIRVEWVRGATFDAEATLAHLGSTVLPLETAHNGNPVQPCPPLRVPRVGRTSNARSRN